MGQNAGQKNENCPIGDAKSNSMGQNALYERKKCLREEVLIIPNYPFTVYLYINPKKAARFFNCGSLNQHNYSETA